MKKIVVLTMVLGLARVVHGFPFQVGMETTVQADQEQNKRSEDDGRCTQITAHEALAIVTENCPSPIGLCAAGVVTGDELIRGTLFVSVLGLAPSIGLPGIEPPTNLSVAADRTLTTSHGTLMFRVAGVFDTARGEIAEVNRVTGGTGRFEGATGTLWITGRTSNAAGTAFEGNLTGQICTNRP